MSGDVILILNKKCYRIPVSESGLPRDSFGFRIDIRGCERVWVG